MQTNLAVIDVSLRRIEFVSKLQTNSREESGWDIAVEILHLSALSRWLSLPPRFSARNIENSEKSWMKNYDFQNARKPAEDESSKASLTEWAFA